MDLVNAGLELAGAAFVALNAYDIQRKRAVAGQSFWSCAFFLTWGLWNLIFYPFVGAHLSAIAGAAVVLANVWLIANVMRFPDGQPAPSKEVDYGAAV